MTDLTDLVLASPLGRELARDEAAKLAKLVVARELSDGEVLVAEGSRDAHLHVITKGRIAVARRDPASGELHVMYTLEAGELVGELSFMDDEVRYASLVATGPASVLVLARQDFETLLEREPQVVYKVMRAIMRVAHAVQRRLSRQMLELQNYLYRTGAKY